MANSKRAKQLYAENPALRNILKELFSEKELGLETSALTQRKFNAAFNKILKNSTQRYLTSDLEKITAKKKTHIEVYNSKGEWILNYDTDPNYFYFQYHYGRIFSVLRDKLSFKIDEFQYLMKIMVESKYKMSGVTPSAVL